MSKHGVRLNYPLQIKICWVNKEKQTHNQSITYKKGKNIAIKQAVGFYLDDFLQTTLQVVCGGVSVYEYRIPAIGKKILLKKMRLKKDKLSFSIIVEGKEVARDQWISLPSQQ